MQPICELDVPGTLYTRRTGGPADMQQGSSGPLSPSGADLVPGRYRLGRLLGRGGMGEVYLARDLALGREVAIKVLTPDRIADPIARRRLVAEARAAAAIDHPFICPVYDSGETPEGRAYIVMQHVEGPTLSDVLQHQRLSVREMLTLGADIAEGLSAAHKRGIVHRDLKPSNVIVTPSGAPKLLDLGIAKNVPAPHALPDGSTQTAVTHEGTLVGTPAYMSPEQIQQRPVDGRSDLFSLGALLFEGLTGRRPFQAPTALETVANVLHVDPPKPSSLRRELTESHDVLCRRLLAKNPADRFQSAEEVTGAIRMLLPEASRSRNAAEAGPAPPAPTRRPAYVTVSLAVVITAGTAAWMWGRTEGLPPVPPEAQVWYERGIDAIREGAYLTGRTALEQAIKLFPQHALAYARLAEADAELDDDASAQSRLIHLARLVPDEDALPSIERLRLSAVRALVVRDVDGAIAAYRELVERRPAEPGAWLDLGRAQQTAGLLGDAAASYQRAVELDRQYAAAHQRLAYVLGVESKRDASLAAFSEAEGLYKAASSIEGETEVLLLRGTVVDGFGDLKAARADFERALRLSEDSNATYQNVRARLALAGITASEGRFGDAERMASNAVTEATRHGLHTVAANGLVDLAWLMQHDRQNLAHAQLDRALELAEKGAGRRTIARIRIQKASVFDVQDKPREALSLIDEVLPFVRTNRYRGFELNALSIASRAHITLDNLAEAKKTSAAVLSLARELKDEAREALGARGLAYVTEVLGDLPEALRLRERSEAILRKHGDQAALPYELANRADLLSQLGRFDEADTALRELETGIAARKDAYVGRGRRLASLRAFMAAASLRCGDALHFVRRTANFGPSNEEAALMARAVGLFCESRREIRLSRIEPPDAPHDRSIARELRYWRATAALSRDDPALAVEEARTGLELLRDVPNDELRWRLAAVAAIGSERLGKAPESAQFSAASRAALDRIRKAWGADFRRYAARADLSELITRSGLS
jgi:tetratricopeptide (TPR) repeat protein